MGCAGLIPNSASNYTGACLWFSDIQYIVIWVSLLYVPAVINLLGSNSKKSSIYWFETNDYEIISYTCEPVFTNYSFL